MIPRRSRRVALLVLNVSWAMGSAASAAADEIRVSAEQPPTPAGDAGLLVPAPDARGARQLRARVLLDYASEPLVLILPSQSAYRVVRQQLILHAQLSLSLAHRVLLSLDLPYVARVTGDLAPAELAADSLAPLRDLPAAAPHSLGDARLGARARLLGGPAGPALAVGAALALPTSGEGSYAGEGKPRLSVFTSAGARGQRSIWAATLGYELRESRILPGVLATRVGSGLGAGIMGRVALDPKSRYWVGPELRGHFTLANGAKFFDPRSSVVHALLGFQARPWGGAWELGGGFGPGLAQGVGSADFRAFAYLGWSPEEPPPPPDRDEDQVPDASDVCLNLPGEPSSDPLMNGCPALPLDTDTDSIPDVFDACPREAGVPTDRPSTHGCPATRDSDQDGIRNERDACPEQAGPSSEEPTRHGCPVAQAPPAAQLVEQTIVISEQIQFETGTAQLRASSAGILAEVANVLRQHPEIERVEVQGHTDDTGNPELNLQLSTERAQAVVQWLTQHAVEATRLIPKGYGQDRPLSDNRTEQGRARNRRVEFRIVSGPAASGAGGSP